MTRPVLVLVFASVAPQVIQAQHEHRTTPDSLSPAATEFLSRARVAAQRFRDPRDATLAGYKVLGPDFPGMGYHWVNGELAARTEIDPDHPPVISYLEIDGRPVLTGVAFALPVRADEALPGFPFPGAWHVHSGTVDDETLLLNPASMKHGGNDGWKLGMLHAWVLIENPAGVFDQDNWALPFVRLKLSPPKNVTPQQGKALHLAAGGEQYYLRLMESATRLDRDEKDRITHVLSRYAEHVRTLVEQLEPGPQSYHDVLPRLEQIWTNVWKEVRASVREDTWNDLSGLSG